tara:strand:+ start:1972 stop:2346 length:375 start_codon:yes stop_codon:yes gene_type:complete
MTQQLSAGIGGGDLDTKAAPGTRLGDARQEDMLQKLAAKKAIEKSNTATASDKSSFDGGKLQAGIKKFMAGWTAAQKAKALEIENREAESRSIVADTLRMSEESARARGESLGSLSSAMQGFFR